MKIAIHHKERDFSSKWVEYCIENQIPYKLVNSYSNNIISDIKDCDGFMWHFHQSDPKDILFAKQLLYSIQVTGKKVFPDFNTAWHFDDKVGQKYLLEAINAPLVPSYVFYDRREALEWINNKSYPKVFKLRGGAGSAHVRLVKDKKAARKIVYKAFSSGFKQYDPIANLKERWRKYKLGKTDSKDLLKGLVRFFYSTRHSKIAGPEIGYVYFQDFMPNNDSDFRVIVIDGKAFAIKRLVRKNDFRASGSGHLIYDKSSFDEDTIKLSFEICEKLKCQSLSIDYVYKEGEPYIVEISYGFPYKNFIENCEGYWDSKMIWHEGSFNAQGWMVQALIKNIEKSNVYNS